MTLALFVGATVAVVLVVIGVVGYLIDSSAERHEPAEGERRPKG
jgi:hypothetical protein